MKLVSPKHAAQALGVSESSLKRWCDSGLIEMTRTAGGHRRLSVDSITEFSRQTSRRLLRPELLDLPATSPAAIAAGSETLETLTRSLIDGRDDICRQLLINAYLAGATVADLGDQLIAPAMRLIGEQWQCGSAEVFQERRAVGICRRVIDELRSLVPPPAEPSRLAIGGTPESDPYDLPTLLVELVLRQAGWESQSLGARLPWNTLLAAIREVRPQMFWLSVSHLDDEAAFLEGYRQFYSEASASTAILVGGRGLHEALRREMQYSAYCDNLQHLVGFCASVQTMSKPEGRS